MRVLLTGSAGFIGGAVASALEADGDEVVRVDLMLPMAHGEATAPAGTHQLDVRDAGSTEAWTDLLAGVSEDVMKAIVGQIPVGRLGEADEVARCVVFLAADEAAWITGSTLTINGGQFMD